MAERILHAAHHILYLRAVGNVRLKRGGAQSLGGKLRHERVGAVLPEDKIPRAAESGEQMDLFSAAEEAPGAPGAEQKARERERRRQEAILAIQRRYGSNAILKGMNLEEGATTRERNKQIGGHRA